MTALHEDPDRLRTPLVRRGGELVEATWDEAFAEVDRRLAPILEQHGRNAVGVYLGNPSVHNLSFTLYGRVLLKALGTRNIFSASTVEELSGTPDNSSYAEPLVMPSRRLAGRVLAAQRGGGADRLGITAGARGRWGADRRSVASGRGVGRSVRAGARSLRARSTDDRSGLARSLLLLPRCDSAAAGRRTAPRAVAIRLYEGGRVVIHEGAGRVKRRSRTPGSWTSRITRRPGRGRKHSSHPFGRAARARVSCGARGLNQDGGRQSPRSARRGH
jgi:Molybdopterin oxidoreductase